MHQSGKTYGHEVGFSCAFRQPTAQSHCRFLHGYALAFSFLFEAKTLDENGWVIDFGSMKSLKQQLENTFDHKTVIAVDDPHLDYFRQGNHLGVLDLVVLPGVGCENFAKHAYSLADFWLEQTGHIGRVKLVSVKVAEHGANHATYINPVLDITTKMTHADRH